MFDRQTFFNSTVLHLHQQGAPAFDHSDEYEKGKETCLYRQYLPNEVVRKCAIGCHIPDKLYNDTMEDKRPYALHKGYPQLREFIPAGPDWDTFLIDLQDCHDDAARDARKFNKDWWEVCAEKLKNFAEQYKLSINDLLLQ